MGFSIAISAFLLGAAKKAYFFSASSGLLAHFNSLLLGFPFMMLL